MQHVVELIRKVRDGQSVAPDELCRFVQSVAQGQVPDYQTAAFLMAVFLKGLPDAATVALTRGMRDSGRIIDLGGVSGTKVDKHSTGGVGDKISLALAPLVAACGVSVPMVSGRGLGHTGGTLDKLEAIPGFRVTMSPEAFVQQVERLGTCLMGQTEDLVPADRILYALRDVTATVESVPLITSSILSKKLAEGIDALVLDVKVGRGAFMQDEASARALAESLVRVGEDAGLRVRAVLTNMDQPLGRTIGNALEVREALEVLRGAGPESTAELTLTLGAEMLVLGGAAADITEGRRLIRRAMMSGAGREKLRDVIVAQGGDGAVVDAPEQLPAAEHVTEIKAASAGVVHSVDALALGKAAMWLGAGRERADDVVDPAVGLEVLTRIGDRMIPDEPLVRVHHNQPLADATVGLIEDAFEIDPEPITAPPLILGQL
mgnify:CR=1 FL=1